MVDWIIEKAIKDGQHHLFKKTLKNKLQMSQEKSLNNMLRKLLKLLQLKTLQKNLEQHKLLK